MSFDPAKQIHYVECKYALARLYQIQTPLRPAVSIVTQWLSLSEGGLLSISAGYAWDGPSGPTKDTPDTMRAALVHDALYDLMRRGYIDIEMRAVVDEFFHAILVEDQVACGTAGDGRAALWLAGVKTFAEFAARAGGAPPVLVAPREFAFLNTKPED